MENYYTVSQKSDFGRLQEVLGLGFTRGPNCKAFIGKSLVFLTGGRLREVVAHVGSIVCLRLNTSIKIPDFKICLMVA